MIAPHRFLAAMAVGTLCLFATGCHSLSGRKDLCDTSPEITSPVCDGCDLGLSTCDGCDYRSRQIVRGRPLPLLDTTGSVLGVVNKLALWDVRADNHNVGAETETEVARYLHQNRLDSVLVRVNQYDPIDEWRRLVSNDRIAIPWRATFGTVSWLKYTLIPGRLVGGDWYSPYTDSVHLYSDIPAIGLTRAAYAKDVHSRTYPGTYATFQGAPVVGLWHETLANQDVRSYLKEHATPQQQADADKVLYPDYGGAWGSHLFSFFPYGDVYGRAIGAMTGHAVRTVKEHTAGKPGDSITR